MSDNHQRYRSIRTALSQMFLEEPKGYGAKQLNVLASLISTFTNVFRRTQRLRSEAVECTSQSDQRHSWQSKHKLSENCKQGARSA